MRNSSLVGLMFCGLALPWCSGGESDDGVFPPFSEVVPSGKEDGAGARSIALSTDVSRTSVWEVRNQWEDRNTAEARKAGLAWDADSSLNWDEKYSRWVESMPRINSYDGSYTTFSITNPRGKLLQSPALECAETAIFLRALFASWYGLPFYMEAVDGRGTRIFLGHFGWRVAAGKYGRTPDYAAAYKDLSGMTAAEIASRGWPQDQALRGKKLDGGGDDLQPFISERAYAGAYLDELLLNKRVGHFLMTLLSYFGSINLADSANTYNLKPEAIRSGDVLLERWQRRGIGHTLVLKHVAKRDDGTYDVELVSGSMPRRQPKWEDAATSKYYFTADETGGMGTNSDGDAYAALGGGLKRWRAAKAAGSYWINTFMDADASSWISSRETASISRRPGRFEELLTSVSPEEERQTLLAKIDNARNHLRGHPASCSARTNREAAFSRLYELEGQYFGNGKEQADRSNRLLEDYVFAELDYSKSKTCCWNSTTGAMYEIVMAYNTELVSSAGDACVEPLVFKARGGSGYTEFASYAQSVGRGFEWLAWSEDEPCPQRGVSEDTETPHAWSPFCSVRDALVGSAECTVDPDCGGGDRRCVSGRCSDSGGCAQDGFEPNDGAEAAAQVAPGAYSNLRLCAGDEDWYGVQIEGAATLRVKISFASASGDIDLQVLEGATGGMVGSSTGTGDFEEVNVQVDPGYYLVHVFGYQGAANAYALEISF